jgi:peroxiredoxin
MSKVLPPGAPDFTLPVTPDQKLSLRELRGHPVILAFYPADWSPVCGDQMALYNEILPEFQKFGAELVGVSVDGVWCHRAFAEARHLHFPLLADFEPKGDVARAYGAYRSAEGVSERALFVIDKNGIITWSYCSPIAVNPRGRRHPGSPGEFAQRGEDAWLSSEHLSHPEITSRGRKTHNQL